MDFLLEGVATIADEAVIAAREVVALISEDRRRLIAASGASVMPIRLMDQLPTHPVVTISTVVKLLKTTKPTAGKAVQLLEDLVRPLIFWLTVAGGTLNGLAYACRRPHGRLPRHRVEIRRQVRQVTGEVVPTISKENRNPYRTKRMFGSTERRQWRGSGTRAQR
jgi:hypothetical protein